MSVPQNRRAGFLPRRDPTRAPVTRHTSPVRRKRRRQADNGWIGNLTARSAATRWIVGGPGWRTQSDGVGTTNDVGTVVANDCQAIN